MRPVPKFTAPDNSWGVRMLYAKFGRDPLKNVAVHKEQKKTDARRHRDLALRCMCKVKGTFLYCYGALVMVVGQILAVGEFYEYVYIIQCGLM